MHTKYYSKRGAIVKHPVLSSLAYNDLKHKAKTCHCHHYIGTIKLLYLTVYARSNSQ